MTSLVAIAQARTRSYELGRADGAVDGSHAERWYRASETNELELAWGDLRVARTDVNRAYALGYLRGYREHAGDWRRP